MRATKYTKRITIQKMTAEANDIGGWRNVWTDLFTTWASVAPVKGYKKLQYAATEYNEIYEVEMRSRQVNADADCRLLYKGTPYQILTTPVEENSKITFDIGRNLE